MSSQSRAKVQYSTVHNNVHAIKTNFQRWNNTELIQFNVIVCLRARKTEKFTVGFFAYLITITSQVRDLFWEQGSIQLAMMLQTNHCLLYLSVSFTHLKRSTDSVILIGREPCPFAFGLIWRLLQNGLYCCCYPSFPRVILYVCPCVCACVRVDESVCFGFWYSSCIVTLFKEMGQNSVLSSSRFGSPLKV